jgi:arylsulfatase A
MHSKTIRCLPLAALLLGPLGTLHGAEVSKPSRPNIILVLSDDVGLSRISCYGGAPFKTPCLDQLAATGLRFERCYSMPICGPSRAALLTGKYPFRTGAVDNGSSIIDPEKHPTVAMLLKDAGYATCAIGKLGQSAAEGDPAAPQRLGFDESMLWMGRATPDRYWNPRYYRNGQVVQGRPDEYGPDLTHEFLVDFMQRHRDQPFFVYYSAVLAHWPLVRTPDSQDETQLVQDMVAYLDKQMGRLAADLERLALRDNTILLFTSDNGPQNSPLGTVRGQAMIGEKGDVGEGGVREPLIVNCPALVPAGRTCRDLTDFTDLLPTLLELAQDNPPPGLHLDGRSIAPQILGRPGQPREWVYAQHGRDYFIADQRYKLYGDGRFVDISDSPIAETPIDSPDEAAAKAKQRLAAALAELRAGVADIPRPKSSALRAKVFASAEEEAAQLKIDLQVLATEQIVANADEWIARATLDGDYDGQQVAELLIQAAGKFQPAAGVNEAIAILRDQGVINSVSYWQQNSVPGGRCSADNVARLVNKLAQMVRGVEAVRGAPDAAPRGDG